MKWKRIYSYKIHDKLIWTSNGVQMNFLLFKMKWNQIYSYEFTHSSYENHMNFISKD